jgi:hypothetical protein
MNSLVHLLQMTLVLAEQAAQGPATPPPAPPLSTLWQQVSTLDMVGALTFISFGIVCLFYGWRIFKILVTICFGLLGLVIGIWANERLIGGNVIWLAMICVAFFAVLSVPLMRWGVSLLGSLSGGILTAGATLAIGLHDQNMLLAGGIIGLVAGGMISFIVFKVAVILFTSLGGSTLVAVGFLAVLYRNLDPQRLEMTAINYRWFLPVMVLAPMLVGIILQYRCVKTSQDWNA